MPTNPLLKARLMLTTTRRTRSLLTLAAVAVLTGGLFGALLPALSGAGAQAATPATATPPAPLVGFNENWNTQAGLTQILTDADIAALKKTGATSVRFPVRCNTVGACAFTSRNNDSIDFSKVTTWNWTQLDAAVAKLLAAGITPIVGPHPGDRMYRPGWIVDDAMFASTKAYVTNIASHLAAKFGPLPYSMFETDLTTSLTTGLDGVQRYRYLTAQGFPASFAAGLAQLYPNVAALNAAYGTAYPSFAMVPVPDLGSSLGVPSTVFDSPATTDLRKIIGTLSAGRYSTIGQAIHAASPGSEFWGPTVQLQSFDDSRQVHTNTLLTPH